MVRIEVVPLLVAPNSGSTLFISVVGISKPILCASLLLVENFHKDKVDIKCMGSVGGKTPTKLEIYLSSNLGHNKIDIIHIVHSYHG
jgi:hypothetical protein